MKWKPNGWALAEQTEIHFTGLVGESALTITWLRRGIGGSEGHIIMGFSCVSGDDTQESELKPNSPVKKWLWL